MREISPFVNLSASQFFDMLPPEGQEIINSIRQEKEAGIRSRPSANLVDCSSLMTEVQRKAILDKIAGLVDENICGRSDMCMQFADLLSRTLSHLKFSARSVRGEALYYDESGAKLFGWAHSWVRVGTEVIDGNVDCLSENPAVPNSVKVAPYWGPIQKTPKDRKLRENSRSAVNPDSDLEDIWWPELKVWLDKNMPQS